MAARHFESGFERIRASSDCQSQLTVYSLRVVTLTLTSVLMLCALGCTSSPSPSPVASSSPSASPTPTPSASLASTSPNGTSLLTAPSATPQLSLATPTPISASNSGDGGSSNLTRGQAAALIKAQFKFPINETYKLNLWTEGFCGGYRHNPCLPEHIGRVDAALQEVGLLTASFAGNSSHSSLTGKGRQFTIGPPFNGTQRMVSSDIPTQDVVVITSTLEFGEVTGIVEVGGPKVLVDYTLSMKVTPFGRVLVGPPTTVARSVRFTRYDDGWRITQ